LWKLQLEERSGQRTPGGGNHGGSPDKFFARGNETLYEAYNQLHTLAQEFDKPFDAPAILVVGQQTDGKSGTSPVQLPSSPHEGCTLPARSWLGGTTPRGGEGTDVGGCRELPTESYLPSQGARADATRVDNTNAALVEGLMGFQFNHVGGGTKTRRPITINMKYNAACTEPVCYLVRDESLWEEELALSDLRDYIEGENRRLEQDSEQFWSVHGTPIHTVHPPLSTRPVRCSVCMHHAWATPPPRCKRRARNKRNESVSGATNSNLPRCTRRGISASGQLHLASAWLRDCRGWC